MELIGYLASLFVGILLGVVGGGGSILTVPVLVYLLHVDPVQATAYSLFVVGVTSLVGAWPKYRQGMVDLRTAVIFGIPSILSVYATRKFLIPLLPDVLFTVGDIWVTQSVFIMVLFALLMIAASVSMIGERQEEGVGYNGQIRYNYPMILLEGTLIGMLTGLVGAGGGFLIIPALVLLSRLPMKMAVGTSLLVIGVKSLTGFAGDLVNRDMDWTLLAGVTSLAIAGFFIGNRFSRFIPARGLKKGFGWLVLFMGIYILAKELFVTL